jgi:hypothetical protein
MCKPIELTTHQSFYVKFSKSWQFYIKQQGGKSGGQIYDYKWEMILGEKWFCDSKVIIYEFL